eukprot:TRINITY_DN103366_c0_g1_i1.p1 TRINITY_DN103366_c0_g1~~TRINITY_DN103366_c0_g1_i1.p1  ORF type:complete len:481 (+),score=66.18 TRINITY_DN103366_c0_g1_i1:16-1458(+)
MDSWRRHGSFRQRARNSERTTRMLQGHTKQRVAVQTHQAIRDFEDNLRLLQDSADVDDIPLDADPRRRWYHSNSTNRLAVADNGSDSSSVKHRLHRSQSDALVLRNSAANSGPLERQETLHAQRPPSPLHVYDYGGITVRPRSSMNQLRNKMMEPARPKYRQETCGHYFPGPDCRQGPYGQSMQDPILMPPRHWLPSDAPPDRWRGDSGDLRPFTAEGLERSGRPTSPIASPQLSKAEVRHTRTHAGRAKHIEEVLGKRREDTFLEHVRFEQGVYDGRWRDPMLGSMGLPMPLQKDDPACSQHAAWAATLHRQYENDQFDLSSQILHNLEEALQSSRGKLSHLFAYVNQGVPGVLEPAEFLEGLIRLGIVEPGDLTEKDIIEFLSNVDPDFDGRVNLVSLGKTLSGVRAFRNNRLRELEESREAKFEKDVPYGESTPVSHVKIPMVPPSLFVFEQSFGKFRDQQEQLIGLMEKSNKTRLK